MENTPLSEVPGIKILHPDTGTPLADSSLKSHSQSTAAQNAVMFLKVGGSARDGARCWDLLARAWLYFSSGYSYYSLQCKYCGTDVETLKVMLSAQYKLSNWVRYPSVMALPGLSD